jgi:hypothetical protein
MVNLDLVVTRERSMGAWGCGLLQNDVSQDALVRFLQTIDADVARLRRRRPTADLAGRLAGAVGLLLQLMSVSSFDPDSERGATLLAVLQRQASAFPALPKTAIDLLGAIRAGKGLELVEQEGTLPAELAQAFFEEEPGFLTERGTGMYHAGLFEHSASAAYVQEVADRCVEVVQRGFADLGEPPEMWEEHGDEIVALCVLLQLQPCRVSAELFRDWWSRYHASEGDDLEGLEEYEQDYRRCLWRALNYGLRRFSGKPKPTPLTLDEPETD